MLFTIAELGLRTSYWVVSTAVGWGWSLLYPQPTLQTLEDRVRLLEQALAQRQAPALPPASDPDEPETLPNQDQP